MRTLAQILFVSMLLCMFYSCAEEKKEDVNDEKIYYYSNGNIKEKGKWKDGKQHGEWVYYDENGNITQTGNWKDGIQDGEWINYIDGKVLDKLTYSNGKITGKQNESN